MSTQPTPNRIAETRDLHGCSVSIRGVSGPLATELFFHCEPPPPPPQSLERSAAQASAEATDSAAQAEAIYRAIIELLEARDGSVSSIVCETVFLRDPSRNLEVIRSARDRVLGASNGKQAATLEIVQPPQNPASQLEVTIQAVVPHEAPLAAVRVAAPAAACPCAECARAHGLTIELGGETRFHAAGLCGAGESAYEQTRSMFAAAEALLREAGMDFGDVVRTWIHLGSMERDYDSLNRGRREFFEAHQIDPIPASTGIGGGPVAEGHDLCLGIYAVKAESPPRRTIMTSPTLNEAPTYGADFVRGMRCDEANKVALHVSGTASIDERGASVHPGDFAAQANRMLVNVAALLEGQGASFEDIVSGVTYVKHASDGERLRALFHEAGFCGFPNAFVEVPVCRPELLCETEVFAVLPKADRAG